MIKRMTVFLVALFVLIGMTTFSSYVSAAPAEVHKDLGWCFTEKSMRLIITNGKKKNYIFVCKGEIEEPGPEKLTILPYECDFLPGTPQGGKFIVHPDGKIMLYCKNQL